MSNKQDFKITIPDDDWDEFVEYWKSRWLGGPDRATVENWLDWAAKTPIKGKDVT